MRTSGRNFPFAPAVESFETHEQTPEKAATPGAPAWPENLRLGWTGGQVHSLFPAYPGLHMHILARAQFNVTGLDDDTLIGSFAGHHFGLLDAFSCNAFMIHKGNDFYRPLQSAFFIIDAAVSGANPCAYHVTNIVIHCLAVCSLLWLFLLLGYDRWVCFFCRNIFCP